MVRLEAVDRALEQMFWSVLRDAQGEPPRLDSVRIDNNEHQYAICIRARFKVDGQPDRCIESSISRHEIWMSRGGLDLGRTIYDAGIIWSRCYEDHYVRRMRDTANAAAIDAYRVGDVDRAESIRSLSEHLTEHAVAYHPRAEMTATEARLREAEFRVRYEDMATDRIQPFVERTQRRLTEHIERQLMSSMQTNTAPEASEVAARGLTAETLQEACRALERASTTVNWRRAFVRGDLEPRRLRTLGDYYDGLNDLVAYGSTAWIVPNVEVGTKEAQERGLQLLKDNLTAEQIESYEMNKFFDIKGGESGTTYRIRHGRQMNIEVLGKDGKRRSGICFLPVGSLVAGDCMLAQKTALELYEAEALKIANLFP